MTRPALFTQALKAMTDGPLGSDVTFGAMCCRGVLTQEYREQDTNGVTQQVWVTILEVADGVLPVTCKEGSTITVDGTDYVVRRRGRIDDMGAREYLLALKTD